jgi:hypothetical protein
MADKGGWIPEKPDGPPKWPPPPSPTPKADHEGKWSLMAAAFMAGYCTALQDVTPGTLADAELVDHIHRKFDEFKASVYA